MYDVARLTRQTGHFTDFYTADVEISGVGSIEVSYDIKNRNLILHQWYRFTEEILAPLRTYLNDYFESLLAK